MNPEILRQEALLFGAGDARVIRAAMIPVEDAVVEMCRPPACDGYGKSANCPPFVISPAEASSARRLSGNAHLFIAFSP